MMVHEICQRQELLRVKSSIELTSKVLGFVSEGRRYSDGQTKGFFIDVQARRYYYN